MKIKRFFYKLKRVWDFLPIIWKGDDYDYEYSIDLFKYQLNRTADYIQDRSFIVDADDVATKIRTATKLMDKIYDDWDTDLAYRDKAEPILWKFIGHNIRKWWD